MSPKVSKELSKHRLEQAREDLEDAELLYSANRFEGANNRAYYYRCKLIYDFIYFVCL